MRHALTYPAATPRSTPSSCAPTSLHDVSSPGPTPLLVVIASGFGMALFGLLIRRSFLWQGVGLLAGATGLGLLQAHVRTEEPLLVLAGVAVILGTAALVTRGRLEMFFDRYDEGGENLAIKTQIRVLLLASTPIAVLMFFYRSLLQ